VCKFNQPHFWKLLPAFILYVKYGYEAYKERPERLPGGIGERTVCKTFNFVLLILSFYPIHPSSYSSIMASMTLELNFFTGTTEA
jgi:hypothetical protein